MNKRVSLITLHAVKNYGSVLQAFATQELLKQKGLSVTVLNYIKPGAEDRELAATWAKSSGKNLFLTKIIMYPTIQRWKKVFGGFCKSKLNLTKKQFRSEDDFLPRDVMYDAYCVGSDQVWNSNWNNGILKPFFLTFAPEDSYKFSFSSSIGKENFDENEKEATRKMLMRFNRLSVREDRAVSILKDLGLHSVQHLDPTLALDAKFWSDFSADSPKRNKPYLLVYQLNRNSEFDFFAKQAAKKMGLELVRICTRFDQFLRPGTPEFIPSVERFVSLFKNADFVITDSFHGTGFSINMNRPFISIYPDSFSSRISSILSLAGLEDRRLKGYGDFSQLQNPVDFKHANAQLNKARKQVSEYLDVVTEDIYRNDGE